jgi:predicted DNA-binding transcriptional regulator AlpA
MSSLTATSFDQLPDTGYLRQAHLIGSPPVTPDQAAENKAKGKGPKRPTRGSPAIVPISSATLWRKCKAGDFPKPVKLSERVTAWRVSDVRGWLAAQAKVGAA